MSDATRRALAGAALFNGRRYPAHGLPPWSVAVVYPQWTSWCGARVFEFILHNLNELLRVFLDRASTPTAVVFDGPTLQSTPESGHRLGYDVAKKRKGSKAHTTGDTLGHVTFK